MLYLSELILLNSFNPRAVLKNLYLISCSQSKMAGLLKIARYYNQILDTIILSSSVLSISIGFAFSFVTDSLCNSVLSEKKHYVDNFGNVHSKTDEHKISLGSCYALC